MKLERNMLRNGRMINSILYIVIVIFLVSCNNNRIENSSSLDCSIILRTAIVNYILEKGYPPNSENEIINYIKADNRGVYDCIQEEYTGILNVVSTYDKVNAYINDSTLLVEYSFKIEDKFFSKDDSITTHLYRKNVDSLEQVSSLKYNSLNYYFLKVDSLQKKHCVQIKRVSNKIFIENVFSVDLDSIQGEYLVDYKEFINEFFLHQKIDSAIIVINIPTYSLIPPPLPPNE